MGGSERQPDPASSGFKSANTGASATMWTCLKEPRWSTAKVSDGVAKRISRKITTKGNAVLSGGDFQTGYFGDKVGALIGNDHLADQRTDRSSLIITSRLPSCLLSSSTILSDNALSAHRMLKQIEAYSQRQFWSLLHCLALHPLVLRSYASALAQWILAWNDSSVYASFTRSVTSSATA